MLFLLAMYRYIDQRDTESQFKCWFSVAAVGFLVMLNSLPVRARPCIAKDTESYSFVHQLDIRMCHGSRPERPPTLKNLRCAAWTMESRARTIQESLSRAPTPDVARAGDANQIFRHLQPMPASTLWRCSFRQSGCLA
jgi:hypothetical protein